MEVLFDFFLHSEDSSSYDFMPVSRTMCNKKLLSLYLSHDMQNWCWELCIAIAVAEFQATPCGMVSLNFQVLRTDLGSIVCTITSKQVHLELKDSNPRLSGGMEAAKR